MAKNPLISNICVIVYFTEVIEVFFTQVSLLVKVSRYYDILICLGNFDFTIYMLTLRYSDLIDWHNLSSWFKKCDSNFVLLLNSFSVEIT